MTDLIEEAAKAIDSAWGKSLDVRRNLAKTAARAAFAVFEKADAPTAAQEAQERRISDLRQARDALSGALAHRLHHTDPDMFFLAVRQMLNSTRYLVDGYAPDAEEMGSYGQS